MTKKSLNSTRSPGLISIVSLAVVFIGMSVWRLFNIPLFDDISYSHICLPGSYDDFWNVMGQRIRTWNEVWGSSVNHWLYVNGRFSNILTFAVLHLPHWLSGIINSIFASLTVLMIGINIRGTKTMATPWIIALLSVVIWALLPFDSYFASTCYYINYVWAGVFGLVYSCFFLKRQSVGGLFRNVGLAFICFVTGWFHEQLGIALCVSSMIVILSSKDGKRHRIGMTAMLALGTALASLAPSTFFRLSKVMDHTELADDSIISVFLYFPVLFIYLFSLVSVWLLKGRRQIISHLKTNIFWVSAAATALLIACILVVPKRGIYFSSIFILILNFRLFLAAFHSLSSPKPILACCCICLSALFFVGLDSEQIRVYRVETDAIEQMEENGGCCYLDYPDRRDIPWWTFGMIQLNNPIDMPVEAYINNSDYRSIYNPCILPPEYHGVAFGRWPEIPGNNNFRGEFPNVFSLDSLSRGTVVDLRFDKHYTANFPPYLLPLTIFMNREPEYRGQVTDVVKVRTEYGEILYLYRFSESFLGRYHRITRIDM